MQLLTDPTQVVARTAWAEARSEGATGMQAVMNTFVNRASRPAWWGRDLLTVCLCANRDGIHQYSCWNATDPNRAAALAVTTADPQFVLALGLAAKLVAGSLPDITLGSDSYYAPKLATYKPEWATDRFYRCTIGRHAFYRVGPFGEG